MAGRNDDFTQATKDLLAKRVGYLCSKPDCRKATSGPHTQPNKVTNVGVAAHITAAQEGGPRYDASLNSGQRKDVSNGIWLCQTHAKLIDSDVDEYPKDLLFSWKLNAEQHAKELVAQSTTNDWLKELPQQINRPLVNLCLTTPPPTTQHIGRSDDGRYWLVHWDSLKRLYKVEEISEGYAAEQLEPVRKYMNVNNWHDLFRDR